MMRSGKPAAVVHVHGERVEMKKWRSNRQRNLVQAAVEMALSLCSDGKGREQVGRACAPTSKKSNVH
jgi:hypothetical protein